MKTRTVLIVSVLTGCFGFVLYALHHHWIVIAWASNEPTIAYPQPEQKAVTKKNIALFFWRNDKWHKEQVQLLWSEDKALTIQYIVTSWLNLLDQEQIMPKKIALQSALLAASGSQIYLSFDRSPFSKESPTGHKWMWVEGLLKTLRENQVQVQGVHFMVHHKPLRDYHLDFTLEWPLSGFLQDQK